MPGSPGYGAVAGSDSKSTGSFHSIDKVFNVLQISTEHLTSLLADQEPPCISLYLPTHRRHPENEGDPIRYRNQLRELEASLREKYSKRDILPLLKPFQALAHDTEFWNHRTDGLAILSVGDKFQIFDLQRPVKELLVVADSFHIKPLLRVLQSADRFQILCLGLHGGRLFEGTRDALDPVDVVAAVSAPLLREGRQSHKDTDAAALQAYLRPLDVAVLEQHSRPSALPLLLVALPEMQAAFREITRNPFLVEAGIATSPETLDIDVLRTQAWQCFEPHYLGRLAKLVDSFESSRARGLGVDLLEDVAAAAAAGRIGTLLVEADREIPGRMDATTGAVTLAALANPEVDDLIDDLAEAVLRTRGEVVVVPGDRMPGPTGLAAILRF